MKEETRELSGGNKDPSIWHQSACKLYKPIVAGIQKVTEAWCHQIIYHSTTCCDVLWRQRPYRLCGHCIPRVHALDMQFVLGILKLQKFILWQFWRPAIGNWYYWDEIKVYIKSGLHSLQGTSIPCLFWLLVAACIPWLLLTSLKP